MVEAHKLSIWKTILFIIFLIGSPLLYYHKGLKVDETQNKLFALMRQLSAIIIVVGLINMFSSSSDKVFKIVLLVVMVCMFNIYNIHTALKKCKSVPQQYKLTLYVWTVIITIILAMILNNANNYVLISYLYEDTEIARHESIGKDGSSISFIKRDRLPKYCPDDMSKTSDEWVKLSTEEKNNCSQAWSEKAERDDIYSDVYA